jgi:digeranylgeranylglycerophospholipid reductase
MKKIECDVLIVGGSGAGSSAARSAAIQGAKTLIIERNQNTIKPACAEALTCSVLPLLPFKIPNKFLKWNIDGMKLYADRLSIINKGDLWQGHSFERSEINPWLADQAIAAGAKLSVETELIDLDYDDGGYITKAIAKKNNKEIEIFPQVVIAADGANSTVVQLLHIKKEKKCSFAHIRSVEMTNINIDNPHLEQIFFDDFSPKGFAYIFPKSKKRANIGVGSVLLKDKTEDFFEQFKNFDIVKKQIKGGKEIEDRSGYAPVDYSLDGNVHGNVLFTGDAANQNIKPFIEGFLPGIICGDIAGFCASKYLKNKMALNEYNNLIEKKCNDIFMISDQILEYMIKIFDQKNRIDYLLLLSMCSDMFDLTDFDALFDLSYTELRQKIEKQISSRN